MPFMLCGYFLILWVTSSAFRFRVINRGLIHSPRISSEHWLNTCGGGGSLGIEDICVARVANVSVTACSNNNHLVVGQGLYMSMFSAICAIRHAGIKLPGEVQIADTTRLPVFRSPASRHYGVRSVKARPFQWDANRPVMFRPFHRPTDGRPKMFPYWNTPAAIMPNIALGRSAFSTSTLDISSSQPPQTLTDGLLSTSHTCEMTVPILMGVDLGEKTQRVGAVRLLRPTNTTISELYQVSELEIYVSNSTQGIADPSDANSNDVQCAGVQGFLLNGDVMNCARANEEIPRGQFVIIRRKTRNVLPYTLKIAEIQVFDHILPGFRSPARE